MKIKFTNFRCYIDKEFNDIPNSGLLLLKGESGSGKSTFIKGILYALFGTKAVRKPYSFGATTCKVELELGNLKIIRTNKPNRLIVKMGNNSLEDAVAQSLINDKICDYDQFIISSYIPQKNNNSILSLPQTEQIKMLKTLANITEGEHLKSLILEKIKEIGSKLIAERTRVEVYGQNVTKLETELSKLRGVKINKTGEELQIELTNALTTQKELWNKANEYERIQKLKEKLQKLQKTLMEIPNDIDHQLQYSQQNEECDKLQNKIQEFKKNEITDKKTRIDKLKSQLLSTSDIQKINCNITDIREKLQIWRQYNSVNNKLKKMGITNLQKSIDNTIEKLKQLNIKTCPKCNTLLCIYDNQLSLCADNDADSGADSDADSGAESELRDYLEKLKKIEIPDISELESLEYLTNEKTKLEEQLVDNNSIQKQIIELEKMNSNSSNIKKLQLELDAKKTEMIKKPKSIISGGIKKLQKLSYEYHKSIDQINDLQSELNNLNEIEDPKKELQSIEKQINEIRENQTLEIQNRQKIEKKEEYKKWQNNLKQAMDKMQEYERKNEAYLILKNKLAQAQVYVLENIISTINENTNYYLDTFFTNDQLIASLQAVYKGKKELNLKVDTTIKYKGNEYDSIDQLSGGEFDRCTLASICGINSMLNSPLLILDESLSSLDADNNTEILRFLKELAQDKLVIVCSHEAVEGIFDNVLHIN